MLQTVSCLPLPVSAIVDRVGGLTALAAACGCTVPNVWQLSKRGSPLPPHYVLKVEQTFGIHRSVLRPDIYPVERGPVVLQAAE